MERGGVGGGVQGFVAVCVWNIKGMFESSYRQTPPCGWDGALSDKRLCSLCGADDVIPGGLFLIRDDGNARRWPHLSKKKTKKKNRTS